ncbi:glycosyltransferase [Rhizobium rhizogenes]|uniref:glycosyltransferase n=1 Tax=Rhizobium rhizogenes TaxID=359 RepID=UPI001573AB60|nr:glycosyltransferase [Rhizobium rhizogenes]NTF83003.1 glycosyltransferase [Rhizobium rhizogenes]NTI75954.1 glycosyltransferase [Rhizobium rhizogenes]
MAKGSLRGMNVVEAERCVMTNLDRDTPTSSTADGHGLQWTSVRRDLARRNDRLVSIIMCVYGQIDLTDTCLTSIFRHEAGEDFELIIVDNGNDSETRRRLEQWAARHTAIKLIHNATNLNFALGNNIGFAASRGSRVVFLNNDTEVCPEWLRSLTRPLSNPNVKGVQPKLIYPDGSIQAIGIAFSDRTPMGYPIYAGKPGDYKPSQKPKRFRALTAACVAFRASDFASVEGFDTVFVNGQEDVDLCLRLGGGEQLFAYSPEVTIIHHESKTVGRRDHIEYNRQIFSERWKNANLADDLMHYSEDGIEVGEYVPDYAPWIDTGYAVWRPREVGGQETARNYAKRLPADTTIAIKISCPNSTLKDHWGDYHFAVALAAAFLRKGLRARIDFLDSWQANAMPNDINLVLRGISRFEPDPNAVNFVWVISHPDKISTDELLQFDRVFAASNIWSPHDDPSRPVEIEPLLQCTDTCRFYPRESDSSIAFARLYVANSRLVERAVVKQAIEGDITLDIFGEMWDGIAPERWIRGIKIDNVDLPRYYSNAEIILNDHWDAMRKEGFISNRIFDVLACGGNVVTDDVGGMPSELARFCTMFSSAKPIGEAIEEARQTHRRHPDRSSAAAHYIHQNHSFDDRAGTILNAMIEVVAEKRGADRT